MRRTILILFAVCSLALAALPAHAGGNHFIVEAGAGVMHGLSDGDTTRPGHATNLLVGVGGRPAGSAARFFFIIETMFGSYTREHRQNFRAIELERHVFDIGLGARVVLPVFVPQFRIFADIEAVLIGSGTTFTGSLVPGSDSSELDGGLRFAAGVQVRPFDFLSVGLRFSTTAAFDHFDSDGGRGWLVNFDSEAGHYEGTLGVTLYF